MSGLESVGWQDSARENVASKKKHSGEQSVLPAFLNKIISRRRAKIEERKF